MNAIVEKITVGDHGSATSVAVDRHGQIVTSGYFAVRYYTPDEARELAAVLIKMADSAERLA